MPDYSIPSAPAVLLKLEPSRWLAAWWHALHGLIGAALLMANPLVAAAALPLVVWHARRRRPESPGLIVISGSRFALPAAGRFNLVPGPGCRAGSHVVELVFTDRPRSRVLVLRDQLGAPEWRRLRLSVLESA